MRSTGHASLGRHVVIETVSLDRPDWQARLDESLAGLKLGGAILTPPICDNEELIAIFERHGVPLVRIAPARMSGGRPMSPSTTGQRHGPWPSI
ncbi:hypothetical protein P0F65_07185 [Sphingomonas sp. I4]